MAVQKLLTLVRLARVIDRSLLPPFYGLQLYRQQDDNGNCCFLQ